MFFLIATAWAKAEVSEHQPQLGTALELSCSVESDCIPLERAEFQPALVFTHFTANGFAAACLRHGIQKASGSFGRRPRRSALVRSEQSLSDVTHTGEEQAAAEDAERVHGPKCISTPSPPHQTSI